MSNPSEQKNAGSNVPLIIVGLIVILLLCIVAGYFYLQYQNTQNLLQNPTKSAQKELEELVKIVGKSYQLPTNESPTLATVSDKSKLPGDEFFKAASNGDKVLVYSQNKIAILYRPSVQKIISVGPVVVSTEDPEVVEPTKAAASDEVSVALYNGTKTVGLTKKVETTLLGISSSKYTVTSKDNAAKDSYTETIVVDLLGKDKALAEKLAGIVKGKVATLPAGEEKPKDASFLIILGSSYK